MGVLIGQLTFKPKELSVEASYRPSNLNFEDGKKVETTLLAVDSEGRGVAPSLITEVRPGSGQVLVNINQVLAEIDAQYSARVAKQVVENISGLSLENVDVSFNIITNANFIGGQSAGGAMTLSLLSLILDKEINRSVLVTGSVDGNGSIIGAGEIVKKAGAAKKAGATILLVPPGASSELSTYEKVRKCGDIDFGIFINDKYEGKEYCETRYEEKKINIGEEMGLDVIEVSSIKEAMEYYFV